MTMATLRVILFLFLMKSLPFYCFCYSYCDLEGGNKYPYESSAADDTSVADSYDGFTSEITICPDDNCFSYSVLIDQCDTNSSFSPGFYCYCDIECEHFDDCCYGFTNENASVMATDGMLKPELQYWSCTTFTLGIERKSACLNNFLVVDKCPSSAGIDQDLVERCENPMANDTVFFDYQDIFYRNRHCALCHGVDPSELTPYIMFTPCLDNREEFHLCGQRPFLVNGSSPPPVRWCVPDIISHCESETGTEVACWNETARVMINGSIYKNVECAECNGMTVKNRSSLISNCEHITTGQLILTSRDYIAPVFQISYFYPQLQCMNGLRLSGTECVPEVTSWPDCTNRQINLGIITNGSLQCFDGFELLKIQAYRNNPNETIYNLEISDSGFGKISYMEFSAKNLAQKTQLENFTESKLDEKWNKCCQDNLIIIDETCDIERNLFTRNDSNLTWISDDINLFEPVIINGTIYILYNQTTFVMPLRWENDTYYRRLSKEWKFTKEQLFTIYGQIIDVDTCAYIIVQTSLLTETEKDNVTYVIYQETFFPPESYVRYRNGSVRLCWTGPDPPEPISMFAYTKGQYILNIILFTLSSICLLATLITYGIFKELRNLQGVAIMNFVSALLVGQVMLQFVAPNMIAFSVAVCSGAAIVTHYCLLAVFTWTNILAWDLVRHFASSSFLPKRHRETRRMTVYLTIGWSLPLIIIVPCLIIQSQNSSMFRYGKIGSSCWIYQAKGIVLTFLVPVAVSFLLNVVLFLLTAYGVHKSKRDSSVLHKSARERRMQLFQELLVHFKISCLLGFGWSFGFIGAFAKVAAVWTIFIITSALQGIFVFVFFAANGRVRELWRKRFLDTKSVGGSTSNPGTKSTGMGRTSEDSKDAEREKLTWSGSASSATKV
ncbi:uncharacterized protein LOC121407241 [Lytechinus variegatus]|uniref:uncharacterized protein LOC121407241 n=1 Tax=Lytechinus variegatus TaxID=7654 RepID=UPI001BB1DB79|nr:uncharacterized protein LOC121407241 [Lytechinus variegatus]